MIAFSLKYLGKFKIEFTFYIITSFLIGGIGLFLPLITGNIINVLTTNKDVQKLVNLCCLFLIISVTHIIIKFINQKLYIKTQTNAAFQLNFDVLEHFKRVPLCYIHGEDTSYLNQKINNDSNNIIIFTIGFISNLIINIVGFVFSFILLYTISVKIALSLTILIIAYILFYIILKKYIYKMALLNKESQSHFFSALNEQLDNIKFIKEHSVYSWFANKLKKTYRIFLENVLKAQIFFYFYDSIDSLLTLVAQLIVFFLGGIQVINGQLMIGTFTILISYFQFLLTSTKYFSALGKEYQDNMVSYKRIIEILNIKEQKNGTIKLKRIEEISLENIGFLFKDRVIFKNFSYKFLRGKVYGIIGGNGAGKSTLIDLILGLYIDEFTGSIFYNNINIEEIDMINLRKEKISFIEQEPILLHDSIKNNIFLTEFHQKQYFETIIEKFELEPFFKRLPNGLNTIVSERASNLSGGEKQKIALVRQFCKDADLIVCDEPTSALDIQSRNKIFSYLKALKKDHIVIIIAHDDKIKNYCDEILDLS